MPRVVHFEICADRPERAVDFYSSVFGWKIQQWAGPQAYWLIMTGEDGTPGINGGMFKAQSLFAGTINIVEVDSVEDFAAKVTGHGGQIVVPKQPVSGVGYVAYCRDTEGNMFGIFKADPSAK